MYRESTSFELTGSLLGLAFAKFAETHHLEDGCFVILTKELADHLAQLYYNTDWAQFEMDDRLDSVHLPEDIFEGDIDMDKLFSHIGECIYISVYGDPWLNIMSAESMPHGIQLAFGEDAMTLALNLIDDIINSEGRSDFIWELNKAVEMMIRSGMSEEVIRLKFENMMLKTIPFD